MTHTTLGTSVLGLLLRMLARYLHARYRTGSRARAKKALWIVFCTAGFFFTSAFDHSQFARGKGFGILDFLLLHVCLHVLLGQVGEVREEMSGAGLRLTEFLPDKPDKPEMRTSNW